MTRPEKRIASQFFRELIATEGAMPGRKGTWTDAEDELILDARKHPDSDAWIAEQLGRTPRAVRARYYELKKGSGR